MAAHVSQKRFVAKTLDTRLPRYEKSTRHLSDDSRVIAGSGVLYSGKNGEKQRESSVVTMETENKQKINIREPFKSSNCKGAHFGWDFLQDSKKPFG